MGVFVQERGGRAPAEQATLATPATTDDEASVVEQQVERLTAGPRRRLGGLVEKRGRRVQQRRQDERMLMAMYGADFEEGEDIAQQGTSHFIHLLHDPALLDMFLSNEEQELTDQGKLARKAEGEAGPEEAFLRIGFGLRQALRRRVPLGMLRGIEEGLLATFAGDAEAELLVRGVSSYERLLVHAASAYYSLSSCSTEVAGARVVRVANRGGRYCLREPRLHQYLATRAF